MAVWLAKKKGYKPIKQEAVPTRPYYYRRDDFVVSVIEKEISVHSNDISLDFSVSMDDSSIDICCASRISHRDKVERCVF